MKRFNTQAIILNRINYSEADRILKILTNDKGKISVLAKGVRKPKSKLAGGLELFSTSNITFIEGKSELKTVVSTQLIEHYSKIVSDINRTMVAYDFLKFIDKSTEENCDEEYYNLLKNVLSSLNNGLAIDTVYVWFIVGLLRLMGSSINVGSQINKKEFEENTKYNFNFEEMGFIRHSAGQFSPNHIKFIRLLGKVNNPKNLIKVANSENLSKEIKPTLTQCLNTHQH